MKQSIKAFLLRVSIAIIGVTGAAINLFILPIGVIVRCIISWIVAPIVWIIFGNQAYNYLENIGISAFLDEFGAACIFDDDDFPIEYWHLNVVAKLKEYHYYHYDKDYLRRLEFEKEEKERKEQYERDEIKYREFIEQKTQRNFNENVSIR